MSIISALNTIVESKDLAESDMYLAFTEIMSGKATDAQIGAFLVALRMKGESIDEISGAVSAMRSLSVRVNVEHEHLVDIVGTGGDQSNLFNVSSATSMVVAAAGGKVAKHGNRSVSSSSGAADVLEVLGININLDPIQIADCIKTVGLGFMFAPLHHKAMKHAIGPRKELGLRTIFNILGPMTNPAGVNRQLIGVYDKRLCRPMAEVLGKTGSEHILVVHSNDGLDEISCADETFIVELKSGVISEYVISPEDFGIKKTPLDSLTAKTSEDSARTIETLFSNKSSVGEEIVIMNAGAALYVSGLSNTIAEGCILASETISSGRVYAKLKELCNFTQQFTIK